MPLLTVCSLAAVYVVLSALVIFNVEPETFDDFFDAIYWAVVSLTTMGYGDIYPVSTAGRIVTMIFAFFTYEFLDGMRVVLKPGKHGVTEEEKIFKDNIKNFLSQPYN